MTLFMNMHVTLYFIIVRVTAVG